MKTVKLLLSVFICFFLLITMCARPDYTSPLDRGGESFAGEGPAGDDDQDGVANYYDTGSQWMKQSTPTLALTGPETLVIAKDDPGQVTKNLKTMATAKDSIYGDLTSEIQMTSEYFISVCSTYVLTYTVRNIANGYDSKKRVLIVDCAGPEITLKGETPMYVNVNKQYVEPGATALDKVDGEIKNISISRAPSTSTEHDDSVVYSAMDRTGNKSSVTRLVIITKLVIVDSIRPVITLIGSSDTSITIGVGSYSDPGFIVTDNVDDDLHDKASVTGGVNAGKLGNYVIYYNVSDAAGNAAETKTRTVHVIPNLSGPDTTPPQITLLGKNPDTVKVNLVWQEPGYTVWDDRDTHGLGAAVLVKIYNSGGAEVTAVNTGAETFFKINYLATDTAGNKSSLKQRIVVVSTKGSADNVKPVIKLEGAAKCSTMQGTPFVDKGATATDSVPGNPTRINLSSSITRVVKNDMGSVVSFDLFYKTIGQYTITYSVSDEAENSASVTRNVFVKDTSALPPDSMFNRYGVPDPNALGSIQQGRFSDTVFTDGPATLVPKVSSITELIITYDSANNTVNQFGLQLKSGYVGFQTNAAAGQPKITPKFNQVEPQFTISGSGISKLDGTYYIKITAQRCVWVKIDGSFAIIFKK